MYTVALAFALGQKSFESCESADWARVQGEMPGWQVNFARHLQDSTCTELAGYRSDHKCRHVAILCWEVAVLDAMSWDDIRIGMASVVVCDGGVVVL